MYLHKVYSFSWGAPEDIVSISESILEVAQANGYELVSTAILSGYGVLFMKKLQNSDPNMRGTEVPRS